MDQSAVTKLSRRARVQMILTIIFFALTVLALAAPMWIEEVFGISPDGGSGEAELLLAVPFGLASIAFGALTYRSRLKIAAARREGL